MDFAIIAKGVLQFGEMFFCECQQRVSQGITRGSGIYTIAEVWILRRYSND